MYESAILNPKAHAGVALAIRDQTHDVNYIKLGSSHVGQDGFGQYEALEKALFDLNYPIVTSAVLSPSEGGLFALHPGPSRMLPDTGTEGLQSAPNTWATGQSIGYAATTAATATRAALSLLPSDLHKYYVRGWDGSIERNLGMLHLQPWIGSATRTNNGIGPVTSTAANVLKINGNLRGWVAHGDDPSITGNVSLGWRQDSPIGQIKSKNIACGRATGLYLDFCDLLSSEFSGTLAARQFPNALRFQVSNTLGTLSPLNALGAIIENLDEAWGMSAMPLIYYSGVGLRLFRQQFINAFDESVSLCGVPAMKLKTETRVGKQKIFVVDITFGHNDRNDTTISVDGVNNSNTPTGAIANLIDLLEQVQTLWVAELGLSTNQIYFRVRVDTPASFPDDSSLIAYRSALVAAIPALTSLRAIVIDTMEIGSQAEFESWWKSAGVDQVHLNATGYYQIEYRITQGYSSAIINALSGGGGSRDRSRSRARSTNPQDYL